jgi:hypothetical protein
VQHPSYIGRVRGTDSRGPRRMLPRELSVDSLTIDGTVMELLSSHASVILRLPYLLPLSITSVSVRPLSGAFLNLLFNCSRRYVRGRRQIASELVGNDLLFDHKKQWTADYEVVEKSVVFVHASFAKSRRPKAWAASGSPFSSKPDRTSGPPTTLFI